MDRLAFVENEIILAYGVNDPCRPGLCSSQCEWRGAFSAQLFQRMQTQILILIVQMLIAVWYENRRDLILFFLHRFWYSYNYPCLFFYICQLFVPVSQRSIHQ